MPAIDIQIGSMVESVQIVYFISFVEWKVAFSRGSHADTSAKA